MRITELEARFVDCSRSQNRGFRDLHDIVLRGNVRLLCSEIEPSHTADVGRFHEVITRNQRIGGVQLIIDARAQRPEFLRSYKGSILCNLIETAVEVASVNQSLFCHVSAVEVQK